MKSKHLLFICTFFIVNTTLFSQQKTSFSSMDVFELEWAQNPQISPDGNWIVYQRRSMDIMKDRKQSRLWLLNADGKNHTKLTNQDVNESSPVWSPDGTKIAFTSSTDNGSEIFIYWLKTNKIARLTQLDKSPGGLHWSPDGKLLAFTKKIAQPYPTLVKPPKKPKGAKWADHPRVTTRLKYEADGSGYIEPGFRHLFMISAEGGTARQISSGDFNFGTPQWSNNGKSIYFSSNLNSDWEYKIRNSEIYAINIKDGKTTALTDRNGPDYGLAISPNGKQIAYLGYDDKVQTYQVNKIYLMNLDGSNKKAINTKLDRGKSNLKWNPDGKGLYRKYKNRLYYPFRKDLIGCK
jgi:Tol biopolymer transport system component